MWTRVELKARARENLKRYYWAAFVVSLILSLASGVFSLNFNTSGSGDVRRGHIETEYGDIGIQIPESIGDISQLPGIGGSGAMKAGSLFYGILFGVAIVMIIFSLLMSLFVIPVMTVGSNRFYMESRLLGCSAGVGRLFWGFTHHYLNIVLTIFLMEMFIALGTICCVFPGIYLSYCYRMVPYILSENPEMKPLDAMRLSKQMMDGHKFETWVLELSFIGWILLGMFACCIGLFFVQPYYQATYAELYAVLRRPFTDRLNGFGIPEPYYGGGYYQNPYHMGGYGQTGSWDQGGNGYNQNSGWNQGGNGYNQNSGWNQSGNDYGQPNTWNQNGNGYNQNSGWNQSGNDYGQPNAWNQNGNGYDQNNVWNQNGNGYGQNDGWNEAGSGYGQPTNSQPAEPQENAEGGEVKRSEGGPGEGYYLNGEFHPYTDDEKK